MLVNSLLLVTILSVNSKYNPLLFVYEHVTHLNNVCLDEHKAGVQKLTCLQEGQPLTWAGPQPARHHRGALCPWTLQCTCPRSITHIPRCLSRASRQDLHILPGDSPVKRGPGKTWKQATSVWLHRALVPSL